jgi:hypothetical protein
MEQNNKPLFVIDDNPIVIWPVTVMLPMNGGTFGEFQFNVHMKVLSPIEYEQLFKEAPSASKDGEPAPQQMSEVLEENVPIFQRIFTGWDGVKDLGGNDVSYSDEKLAEQVTGKRGRALSVGFWRAISEVRHEARLGN